MKQPTRSLTSLLAFLLFGAPGAPGASQLPSIGEAEAFQGCASVSPACGSICTAWEQCITGGGTGLCDREWAAVMSCANIPEVVVVGIRIRALFTWRPPTISGYHFRWSRLWNTWYVQRRPRRPPPRDATLVGRCFRPVGVAPGLPASIVNWAVPLMPKHHDVRTRKVAAGTTTETTRGFFAVEMARAIFAAWDWVLDPEENDGFVEGVVRDSAAAAGRCNLSKVEISTYDRVLAKIVAPKPRKYHLVLYNCQDWAAEQVR